MKNEELILTLAENLTSKLVDTDVVLDSIRLICDHFHFNGGAVYEIDQFNHFHIVENFSSCNIMLRESFPLEEIREAYNALFQDDSTIFMCDSKTQSPYALTLCNLFHTSSFVLYPIMDSTMQVLGFVLLANIQKELYIHDDEQHILHIALSILSKYVGSRMYDNKISFAITSLESILDNTGIDIYVNDFHSHDILYVNKSMAAPYGGIQAFEGRKCWEVLFPGQRGQCEFCPQKYIVDEQGEPTTVYTWDYQRAFDGSWFRVFSAAFRWVDGRLAHVVSSADITDNKKYEALIDHMANYDSLTDLPNRRMLVKECERRVKNAADDEGGYLLFFDIDGFKEINDTLGHLSGDEFLIQLADFFRSIPMLKNSIYRNGGDEFVAVVGGINITKADIRNLCSFISERFKKPWKLEKGEVWSSTSIGIACYPEDGSVVEDLLQKADQAMYKVKKEGGAKICFGFELAELN